MGTNVVSGSATASGAQSAAIPISGRWRSGVGRNRPVAHAVSGQREPRQLAADPFHGGSWCRWCCCSTDSQGRLAAAPFARRSPSGLTPEMLPMVVNVDTGPRLCVFLSLAKSSDRENAWTRSRTSGRWTCCAPTRPARRTQDRIIIAQHRTQGTESARVPQLAFTSTAITRPG